MRRPPLIALTSLALVALTATVGAPSVGAAARTDIRAKALRLTSINVPDSGFGEPSLAISPKDHVFICGPLGAPAGNNAFVRTADWKHYQRQDIFDPLGGGDCDVKVGPDGAVYTASLQLVGSRIRKSVDDGQTFPQTMAWEELVEQDRQWLATDPSDPDVVYFVYHDFVLEAEIMAKSTDGGQTFLEHSLISNDPSMATNTFPNTFSGPVRVDPTDSNRVYVVYGISSLGSNVNECITNTANCPFGAPETVIVAASDDGGMSWTDHVAMTSPPGSELGHLPWMHLDKAGNIYAFAAGHVPGPGGQQNGMFMSYSTDHGQSWSRIIKINKGHGATAFPAVVGGKGGVADFAWIEAQTNDREDPGAVWKIHFAQSRNAHSARPTFTEVTGPVVHKGALDRALLDFMDMALDSFGYAHMVTGSSIGGLHVLWWRQDSGPSAYSNACTSSRGCVYSRPQPRP
jgi:hypothetical protein